MINQEYEVYVSHEEGIFVGLNKMTIDDNEIRYTRYFNGYKVLTMRTGEEIKLLGMEDKYNSHIYDELRLGSSSYIR